MKLEVPIWLFSLLSLSLTSGCATGMMKSLHQYSSLDMTDVSRERNVRRVEAEAENSVVIATDNTDFADAAFQKLLGECPGGRIVNVTLKHSTDLGILAYRDKLQFFGDCLQ